jgi:hypothetical protein
MYCAIIGVAPGMSRGEEVTVSAAWARRSRGWGRWGLGMERRLAVPRLTGIVGRP